MKESFDMKDLNLKDLERLTPRDIKDAVVMAFPREGGLVRAIFLNSPTPVRMKQDVILPYLEQKDYHSFLFQVNKRKGNFLVEFAGILATAEIRQAIDIIAEKTEWINGGFFPGYRQFLTLPKTAAVGFNANSLNKLRGAEDIRDIRLTNNSFVFIYNNKEIRIVSLIEAQRVKWNLFEANGESIHKFSDNISCLDRVKDNGVVAVVSGQKFEVNISKREVNKGIFQPELSGIQIGAYHEQKDQDRIAVMSNNGRAIVLFPTILNQLTA